MIRSAVVLLRTVKTCLKDFDTELVSIVRLLSRWSRRPKMADDVPDGAVASADFTSVDWFGTRYQFTKTQAACVEVLWREWEKGGLGLSEQTVAEEIGSDNDHFRLDHVFRAKGRPHRAWGTMIQRAGKGIYRLVTPTRR